mmetsp:Transcript_1603/g.4627  ORF Transcript_1603/g.4627 Transcript_1603/m.4627 type:complete len:1077 (+) Transcript_1603:855-4085(+)|eukprot:CAMPEP_0117658894 /NCGR_PEP_ID=MMETSP0804-20121206/6115_1 /TAXON_ID=1074897 /ORGANISM="Tetraselmis astigmatica, Strain CCMP880" /LENGTH=1076 /DNA_ID=CAMNT_0005465461 /DNA_START=798 /DNA_END=4028 /DNA_ORIENTATION=-
MERPAQRDSLEGTPPEPATARSRPDRRIASAGGNEPSSRILSFHPSPPTSAHRRSKSAIGNRSAVAPAGPEAEEAPSTPQRQSFLSMRRRLSQEHSATSSPHSVGSPWTPAHTPGRQYAMDQDVPRGIGSPDKASPSHRVTSSQGSPSFGDSSQRGDSFGSGTISPGGLYTGRLPKAARDGRIDLVDALLSSGALVSEKDRRGRNALHWAAARAHREVAVLLLESGCDPAAVDREGATPLHLAAVASPPGADTNSGGISGDSAATIRRWRSTDADGLDEHEAMHQPGDPRLDLNSSPASLLHTAASTAIVEILIRHSAPLEATDRSGRTPLHFAAWRGQANTAQSLLRHHSSCSARDTDGRTPLHLAAIAGNVPVLLELLAYGANTSETDPAGRTALHLAAYWGQAKAVKELIKGGANIEGVDHDGATALQLASWRGQGDCVKVLRRRGAQVTRQNSAGHTAFHLAAAEGRLEVLTELMHNGNGLRVLDSEMKTLLHVAAEAGKTEVCKYLLRQGADLETVDSNFCTPLHLAVLQGREEVVDLLLKNGASVAAVDEDCSTPLHYAASEGHRRIASALIQAGAEIERGRSDEPSWTPLHQAAEAGQAAIVRLLIASGASCDRKDREGRTALQVAADSNHRAVVALLASQSGHGTSLSSRQLQLANGNANGNGREAGEPPAQQQWQQENGAPRKQEGGAGGRDMLLVAAVAMAMYLQQIRALLYTISNIARRAPDSWGQAGVRKVKKTRKSLKSRGAALVMSPSTSPSGATASQRKPPLDIATAQVPPEDSGIDLQVDFLKEVKPYLGKRLGEGAFGVVYEATWRGSKVAVKVLSRAYKGDRGEQYESFASEVKAMSHVGQDCKRIVRMLGACLAKPRVCIIYELLSGGSLHNRIHDRLRPPLELLEVLQIMHDVAEGLAFLHHTADVVHRDLKPHNILLDKHGRAKIIDFGLSKDIANPCQSYLLTDARGTIQYMAPEAFDCRGGFKADVYAVAVILNECLTREIPWNSYELTYQVMFAVTSKDERPPLCETCPPDLKRLITKCWQKDPEMRPGCHEIMHRLSFLIKEEKKKRGLMP